jgi:hypothetical protein
MSKARAAIGWIRAITVPGVVLLALAGCGGGGGSSIGGGGGGGGGGVAGSLGYSDPNAVVAQAAGSVTLSVNRVGGSSGAVTVNYATSDGTAKAGSDYTQTSGMLNWADGDASPKSFSVPVSNATAFAVTRAFNAVLSAPGGGASLGTITSVAVAINGSGGPSGANQVAVTLSSGPAGVAAFNILYTTATICVHGTATCATLSNVQVDTGSVGFRVLNAALMGTSVSSAALAPVMLPGGALVECTQFADGYSWGPVKTADITVGGETASNVNIQVIGDPTYEGSIPSQCSSNVNVEEDTIAAFGANAILGIGNWLGDCGSSSANCATDGSAYNTCTTSSPVSCQPTAVTSSQWVMNPVAAFGTDSNGVLIQLQAVPDSGAANPTGILTFGIGTQSNNQLPTTAIVYQLDPNYGTFSTVFGSSTLSTSFIDSGSNGYFFPDSALTACAVSTSFYCPTTPQFFTATITDASSGMRTVTEAFTVSSVDAISASDTASSGAAGPTGSTETDTFDWGAPFFFGRSVFIGLAGQTIGGVAGPADAF